jgi:uncharacterized protein (TIGR04255 family)
VQFTALPGFTAAHAGWFWKEYVEKLSDSTGKEWKQAVEAVRVNEVFEKFGSEDIWLPTSLNFTQGVVPPRTQIIGADLERLIQVQDNRFVLNWRKRKSQYPGYEALLTEFRDMLHAFESFCTEVGWRTPTYNQWEMMYVNQIKKGTMWDSAYNLNKIFPALTRPPVSAKHVPLSDEEAISADWRFTLVNRRGRLHIQIRQVRLQPSNQEVIQLTEIARGPVNETQSWEEGVNLGHEAMRETFLAITSTEAQTLWKKGN